MLMRPCFQLDLVPFRPARGASAALNAGIVACSGCSGMLVGPSAHGQRCAPLVPSSVTQVCSSMRQKVVLGAGRGPWRARAGGQPADGAVLEGLWAGQHAAPGGQAPGGFPGRRRAPAQPLLGGGLLLLALPAAAGGTAFAPQPQTPCLAEHGCLSGV